MVELLSTFLCYLVWKKNNGTKVERRIFNLVEQYLVGKSGAQTLLRIKEMGLALEGAKDTLKAGKMLSQNLDSLLFAKDILARTLSYVRYQTKKL